MCDIYIYTDAFKNIFYDNTIHQTRVYIVSTEEKQKISENRNILTNKKYKDGKTNNKINNNFL